MPALLTGFKIIPMKKILIALALAIILSSCSADGNGSMESEREISIESTTIDDKVSISSDSLVTISGLEKGSLYAIFPESRAKATHSGGSGLIRTSGGTFLSVASSDTLTISGSDIGIAEGTFRIAELKSEDGRMIIGEGYGEPLFIESDGTKIFERKSTRNLRSRSAFDPSEATLLAVLNGSGTLATDYGIITEDGRKENGKRLLDLSAMPSVDIYSQLHVMESREPVSYEVMLVSPITIESGEEFALEAPAVYQIGKTGKELVLEIHMDGSGLDSYRIAYMSPDGRSALTGLRRPYIFPMGIDGGTLLIYVGIPDEDTLFSFISGGGTALLRDITADEKESIYTFSGKTMDVTVPEHDGECIIPILFPSRPKGAEVSVQCQDDIRYAFYLVSDVSDGTGYSELMARPTASFPSHHALEYGFLRIQEAEPGDTITINLS